MEKEENSTKEEDPVTDWMKQKKLYLKLRNSNSIRSCVHPSEGLSVGHMVRQLVRDWYWAMYRALILDVRSHKTYLNQKSWAENRAKQEIGQIDAI